MRPYQLGPCEGDALESTEKSFRRLVIGEPGLLASMAEFERQDGALVLLDERTEALVRIGALVALDAPQSAYQAAVETALRAGATLEDLLAVLFAVAGSVGSARVVSAAPKIALAAGYDVDAALEWAGP